mgnify:CR=1 FL=1
MASLCGRDSRHGRHYLRWDALGVDNFLEHVDHIVELPVDVADDDNGLLHAQHIRLVFCMTTKTHS